MRRRFTFILLASCSLLVVVGMIWMMFPSAGVHRGAFNRIREGMFKSEVHAILGGPPGDYRTNPEEPRTQYVSFLRPIGGIKKDWIGDSIDIHVGFDKYDRVLWKSCTDRSDRSGRFWDRIWNWFNK